MHRGREASYERRTRLTSFVALFRPDTVSAARIVAVSADPELVRDWWGLADILRTGPGDPKGKPAGPKNEREGRKGYRGGGKDL
jgi:hypothetical protein